MVVSREAGILRHLLACGHALPGRVVDSGSRDLDGLAAMAERVAQLLASAGMTVARVPVADGAPLGDAVVGRLRGRGGRRVLLAGHLDTVFPRGTAAARPFTMDA